MALRQSEESSIPRGVSNPPVMSDSAICRSRETGGAIYRPVALFFYSLAGSKAHQMV